MHGVAAGGNGGEVRPDQSGRVAVLPGCVVGLERLLELFMSEMATGAIGPPSDLPYICSFTPAPASLGRSSNPVLLALYQRTWWRGRSHRGPDHPLPALGQWVPRPERSHRRAARCQRGSRGGRPCSFDRHDTGTGVAGRQRRDLGCAASLWHVGRPAATVPASPSRRRCPALSRRSQSRGREAGSCRARSRLFHSWVVFRLCGVGE